MGTFKIEGGHQLKGEVTPQGAKRSLTNIMCRITNGRKVTIHNIPDIVDVNKLIVLLGNLGVKLRKTVKVPIHFKRMKLTFHI